MDEPMRDYRDTPAYRAAMKEIERRSLAMSQPGPDEVLPDDVASPPAGGTEGSGEVVSGASCACDDVRGDRRRRRWCSAPMAR